VTIAVADRFRGSWDAFWATTYSFEPELYDEFLFRRLGQPPLNATVLADFGRLARLFAQDIGRPGRPLRANRDYLLRGGSPQLAAPSIPRLTSSATVDTAGCSSAPAT
jgi:hypothetical protein